VDDIARIDIWRQMGHFSYGSGDNQSLFFLFNRVWFWPKPFLLTLRKMLRSQAVRFEYTLTLKNKRTIVIAAEKSFIRELEKTVRSRRAKPEDQTP
jgi:hypothetical protein